MQTHYDVIVLGDSLAGRIAAVQLARSGCRVLALEQGAPLPQPWFSSSLALEKILDQFGGRACVTPAAPFQVLTNDARVDISSRHPLDQVLLREFPKDALALSNFFAVLKKHAGLLENIFMQMGCMPLKGEGGFFTFRWKALRNGLRVSQLKEPLKQYLQRLGLGTPSQSFVKSLFEGLSLAPINTLSMAEAALLWSSHTRTHGVSVAGLDTLLKQRFEQFHGQNEALDTFRKLETSGQQVKHLVLKNGSCCSADFFLIADEKLVDLFNKSDRQSPPVPTFFSASNLAGSLSPLLTERVILGEDPTLRLGFETEGERHRCTIGLPHSQIIPAREVLKERLSTVLPFNTYDLVFPETTGKNQNITGKKNLFGQRVSTRIMRNALVCSGSSILPSLGTTGEVLVGLSIAQRIQSRKPKK